MQTACCNINENQIFMKCQFQCQCFPCSYFEANNQNYKAEFETNNKIIFNDSNDSKKMTKMIFILILIILVKQILLIFVMLMLIFFFISTEISFPYININNIE